MTSTENEEQKIKFDEIIKNKLDYYLSILDPKPCFMDTKKAKFSRQFIPIFTS